jgi:hypothetical protein
VPNVQGTPVSGNTARAPLAALSAGFLAGYVAGLGHGIGLGYRMAEDDQAAAWASVAGRVGRRLSFADLERKRYPEGRPERSCPTCGQPHRDGIRDAGEAGAA